MRRSVAIAVLVGVDSGGASCCGYAWTSDSDRDGDGDDDGDVFGSAVGLPTPSVSINTPEWNQAHRAHQQTKDGVTSPTHLRTPTYARCFKNEREHKTIHKNRVRQSSAPPFVIIQLKTKPPHWTRISAC